MIVLSRDKGRAKACSDALPIVKAQQAFHQAVVCDVSSAASINNAIDTIIASSSRIDILINGAGITHDALLMRSSVEYVNHAYARVL
jgi:NAD(P)-dependent dehydrogenase (short-subunit alcohol dehydrogenase family)